MTSRCGNEAPHRGHYVGQGNDAWWCEGRTSDLPVEIVAGLSSEQRAALHRLRRGPQFLGPRIPAIPRGTAAALRRRGLIGDVGGSQVSLTDLGKRAATLTWRQQLLVLPPGDDEVRMSAIVHARNGDAYIDGCFDSMLGEDVQLRKDLGGAYSGRLIGYEVLGEGGAVKVTLDVPAAKASELGDVNSRWSLPGKP